MLLGFLIFLVFTLILLFLLSDSAWTGNSKRLGNLLDAWYFGKHLGSKERISQYEYIGKDNKNGKCLQTFLDKCLTVNFCSFPPNHPRKPWIIHQSDQFWASYSYENLQDVMPFIQNDLRYVLHRYTEKYLLKNQNKSDALIHFRVGDFISLGYSIPIDAVISATQSLPTIPKTIEILTGGIRTGTNISASRHKLQELQNKLKLAFPESFIFIAPERSADEDFLALMYAPMLVIAGGSFAMLGALVSYATSIRSPACENLNFCQQSTDRTTFESGSCKDWKLYGI